MSSRRDGEELRRALDQPEDDGGDDGVHAALSHIAYAGRSRAARSFVTGSDLPVVFGNLVTYVTRVVRQLSGSSNASCVARCESLPDGTEMVGRVPDRADRHAQCVLVPHGVSLHRHNQTLVLAPESRL